MVRKALCTGMRQLDEINLAARNSKHENVILGHWPKKYWVLDQWYKKKLCWVCFCHLLTWANVFLTYGISSVHLMGSRVPVKSTNSSHFLICSWQNSIPINSPSLTKTEFSSAPPVQPRASPCCRNNHVSSTVLPCASSSYRNNRVVCSVTVVTAACLPTWFQAP